MPSKRAVLDQLKRDELLDAVDRFELEVRDRRVRDELVEALASSRRAALAEILGTLSRARLKDVCYDLGLDDSGREKAVLVERLAGPGRSAAPPPKPADPMEVKQEIPRRPTEEPPPARTTAPEEPRVRPPASLRGEGMEQAQLNWIANFIWGIADDVLRDLYVRGKYRDVILPMTVLRRLDTLLEAALGKAGIVDQRKPLGNAAQPSVQEMPERRLMVD